MIQELNLIKYELNEVNNLMNFLDAENGELDEETMQDTKESVVALLESKSEQIELILKELELSESKCNEYIEMFRAKKENFKNKREKLKHIVLETMKRMDIKKIETSTGTLTVKKNAPSLIVDNEDAIPSKFKTIIQTTKIEKNEIKNAIKNGEIIDGVHLETKESLMIK